MRRILVVDDDRDMQAIYRHMLKGDGASYSVRFAEDPCRALRMLTREPADLVITDVVMGAVSGEAFIARLRESGGTMPVLVVSVLHPEMLPGARAAERVHFLQKPLTGAVLRATLKRILGRRDGG